MSIINNINNQNKKIVLAITGGGTQALSELIKYGGGSNTLLEGIIPYDNKSFDEFIGGKPDKYVSEEATTQLATASYRRAFHLTNDLDVIGVGVSCALAKNNERVGREHNAYIAIQTETGCYTFKVNFGNETVRIWQEQIVTNCIIGLIELFKCGRSSKEYYLEKYCPALNFCTGQHEYSKLLTRNSVVKLYPSKGLEDKIIFPGSFNPLHEGHINIAKRIEQLYGRKICMEISIKNVDKPYVTLPSLLNRLHNLDKIESPWLENVFITSSATFAEKAAWFKNCRFIVGMDTMLRLSSGKHSDIYKDISIFNDNNIIFDVFPRGGIQEFEIYYRLRNICIFHHDFQEIPMSSTEIRLTNQQREAL